MPGPDFFDHLEQEGRAERVEAARIRNEEAARLDAEAAAASRERGKIFSLESNERVRLAEYRAAGVEPPVISGAPTRSSLALLLSIGWTVAAGDGTRELIAPAPPDARPRRSRADYDQST